MINEQIPFFKNKEFLELFREKLDERGLQLLEEYKQGANGVIYLARHMSGAVRAVKVFKDIGDKVKIQFTKELDQLRQIHHKNVINLLDKGHFLYQGNEIYYLIMEFFENSKNLDEIDIALLKAEVLLTRAKYCAQLIDALNAIHSVYEKHNDLHKVGCFMIRND